MVEDLVVNPVYWAILVASMGLLYFSLKFRPLDFKFFIALPIAQRVAHLSILPSKYALSLAFAVLSGLFLMAGHRFSFRRRQPPSTLGLNDSAGSSHAAEHGCYIALSAIFLTFYFGARFLLYPKFFSVLDIGDRLQAQYDHRFIFILYLAAPPALTAVIVRWVQNKRMTVADKTLAALIFVGFLSLGSKASVAPMLLTFFGVTAYFGNKGMLGKTILILGLIGIVGGLALSALLPGLDASQLGGVVLYRLVANTEELEYLFTLDYQPSQYPFAGWAALMTPVARFLGQNIEYAPGVWLYGQRYNNWSGYGPNSGFIIEFFGNLGFFGLIIPMLIGLTVGYADRRPTLYGAVLLSILPLAFMEWLMFIAALGTHICLVIGAKLISSIGVFLRNPRDLSRIHRSEAT